MSETTKNFITLIFSPLGFGIALFCWVAAEAVTRWLGFDGDN